MLSTFVVFSEGKLWIADKRSFNFLVKLILFLVKSSSEWFKAH